MTDDDVRRIMPQTAGAAERASQLSHYHFLGLPIGAPRVVVIERLRVFRDYTRRNWSVAKRQLASTFEADHFSVIERDFANDASTTAYLALVTERVNKQRSQAYDEALAAGLAPGAESLLSAKYPLIKSDVPALLQRLAMQHTAHKAPPATVSLLEGWAYVQTVLTPERLRRLRRMAMTALSALARAVARNPKRSLGVAVFIGMFMLIWHGVDTIGRTTSGTRHSSASHRGRVRTVVARPVPRRVVPRSVWHAPPAAVYGHLRARYRPLHVSARVGNVPHRPPHIAHRSASTSRQLDANALAREILP